MQWRHNCCPAASFANCVVTLYLLKVHLQTFLSMPVIKKCQVLSCDTLVANERYVNDIFNILCLSYGTPWHILTNFKHEVDCWKICSLLNINHKLFSKVFLIPKLKIRLKDKDLRILQRLSWTVGGAGQHHKKPASKIHPAEGEVLGPVYKTEEDYFKGNNTDL